MSHPIIGITLDQENKKSYSVYPWYAARKNYASSVSDLGGTPIFLPHEINRILDFWEEDQVEKVLRQRQARRPVGAAELVGAHVHDRRAVLARDELEEPVPVAQLARAVAVPDAISDGGANRRSNLGPNGGPNAVPVLDAPLARSIRYAFP